jgi:hypothetical protein
VLWYNTTSGDPRSYLLLNGTIMEEKKRIMVYTDRSPWTYRRPTGTPGVYQDSAGEVLPIWAVQTTQSRGHGWPAGRGKGDIGGDFSTIGIKSVLSSDPSIVTGSGRDYTFTGRQYASDPYSVMNSALSRVQFSSDASLQALGTTAIAKSIPTNPVADAATFIGELKSGLPKLVGRELFKTKLKDYRKVGSEYLNVEFGWKPLISDLQKFGKAAIESEKIINQLHRDSGKDVHRRYTFPDEVSETVSSGNARLAWCGTSVYPYCFYTATGVKSTTVISTKVETWFSGCFTYHVNLGTTLPDRIARHAAEARKLSGLELTPEVVWNLAPWSWAVDWEGNIGDVLHNVSRFSQDGLVMRYGYIMQQKTCKIDITLGGGGRLNDGPRSDLTLSVIAQSKIRRRATPFGFGFDMKALSGRQSAILGALGISRGPRHL